MRNLSKLKPIVSIDVKSILLAKKISYVVMPSGWLKLSCLFPDHQDNNPSFFISDDGVSYNCYGCHRHGRVVELFDELGFEYDASSVLVDTHSNYDLNKLNADENITWPVLGLPNGFKKIRSDKLSCKPHYNYCEKRGLDGLIDYFNIGYTITSNSWQDKYFLNRVLVPVHDERGDVAWTEGRTILPNVKKMKWYRPPASKKEFVLFNYLNAIKKNYCVIVEGIFDVLALTKFGIPAVATFGAKISEYQIKLLMSFDRIYVAFDNDEAGNAGVAENIETLMYSGIEIYYVRLPDGKDFDELHYEQVKRILKFSRRLY